MQVLTSRNLYGSLVYPRPGSTCSSRSCQIYVQLKGALFSTASRHGQHVQTFADLNSLADCAGPCSNNPLGETKISESVSS